VGVLCGRHNFGALKEEQGKAGKDGKQHMEIVADYFTI
jgi:hypothetical protein